MQTAAKATLVFCVQCICLRHNISYLVTLLLEHDFGYLCTKCPLLVTCVQSAPCRLPVYKVPPAGYLCTKCPLLVTCVQSAPCWLPVYKVPPAGYLCTKCPPAGYLAQSAHCWLPVYKVHVLQVLAALGHMNTDLHQVWKLQLGRRCLQSTMYKHHFLLTPPKNNNNKNNNNPTTKTQQQTKNINLQQPKNNTRKL